MHKKYNYKSELIYCYESTNNGMQNGHVYEVSIHAIMFGNTTMNP